MSRALTLAVLALCASTLAGPSAGAQSAVDPRLAARLDVRTAASVQAVVETAHGDDLPAEPLVLKALEGASKGARGPQIVAVVGRLHAQLGASRGALGGSSSAAEIVAGVGALQAGVTPETLGDLRAARPAASLQVALTVLADLVARGVPVQSASETVLSLVRANTSDQELASVGRAIERNIRAGTAPGAAGRLGIGGGPPAGLPVTPGVPPPQAKGKGPPTPS
jgi:hypothetical protein